MDLSGPDYRDPITNRLTRSSWQICWKLSQSWAVHFASVSSTGDFLGSWHALRMRPNALARGCAKLGPEVIRKLVGVELVDFLRAQKKMEELSRICPFFQSSVFPLSGLSSQMVYLRCPSVVRSVFFLWTSSLSSLYLFRLCWFFCRLSVLKNSSRHPCASNTMMAWKWKKTNWLTNADKCWMVGWSFERIQVAHRFNDVRCIQDRKSGQIHSAPWSVQSSLPSSASFPGGSMWKTV